MRTRLHTGLVPNVIIQMITITRPIRIRLLRRLGIICRKDCNSNASLIQIILITIRSLRRSNLTIGRLRTIRRFRNARTGGIHGKFLQFPLYVGNASCRHMNIQYFNVPNSYVQRRLLLNGRDIHNENCKLFPIVSGLILIRCLSFRHFSNFEPVRRCIRL